MRIVIEPGSYRCQNMGDVAMLKVALRRIEHTWPGADVRVFNGDPEALARYCPRARPLSAQGRALWLSERRWLPRRETAWPALRRAALTLGLRLRQRDAAPLDEYFEAMSGADLVLACGQGSMGDATAGHALVVLATLEMAIRNGTPTAMLGQGMGPLADPALMRRARAVLPLVDLVALREGQAGPPLLTALGVQRSRIAVTGDDAIELAHDAASAEPGTAIGVNVRVSDNAGTGPAVLGAIAPVLRDAASRWNATLRPLPIARGAAHDAEVLATLLSASGAGETDGGKSLDSPEKVIGEVTRCRIVVTGAYHAAVFALAQGIPVVCLLENAYYRHKFEGLAALFPNGCELVSLDRPGMAEQLQGAIESSWSRADAVRGPLRTAAAEQIARGRDAFASLTGLLARAQAGRPAPVEAGVS